MMMNYPFDPLHHTLNHKKLQGLKLKHEQAFSLGSWFLVFASKIEFIHQNLLKVKK